MSISEFVKSCKKQLLISMFKSKTFSILALVFLFLMASIGAGLFYTSTEFHTSLKPGGGLLDGLIANGISVVISVILISPLTAYFISTRREKQLIPVRRSFVESIASEVDRLATVYIHQAGIYGNAVIVLESGMFGNALENSLYNFNEWLSRVNTRNSAMLRGENADMPSDNEDQNTHNILSKALQEASLIRDMTFALYQTFYRETISLENTISFAMPFFPVQNIKTLHDIRGMLIDYRGSLQDMLAVINGDNDAVIGTRAKNSALDFGELTRKIEALAASSELGGEISERMISACAMDKRIGLKFQRDISRKLVEVFEQARSIDQNNATIRRNGRRAS